VQSLLVIGLVDEALQRGPRFHQVGSAFHSLRYAVTSLMVDKGFTIKVVLTIAVCIAATLPPSQW